MIEDLTRDLEETGSVAADGVTSPDSNMIKLNTGSTEFIAVSEVCMPLPKRHAVTEYRLKTVPACFPTGWPKSNDWMAILNRVGK